MAFILGILAAFFAFIIQVIVWVFHPDLFTLSMPLGAGMVVSLFFLAATEESARVLFSRQYLKNYAKNHLLLGAIFFGIGFAFLEIVLTVWNGFSWKVFGASSFHILATGFTFWWLRENAERASALTLTVLLTLLHACFNLSILFWING